MSVTSSSSPQPPPLPPPPTRDVKFIPETPPPIPHSLDSPQEHHLAKKPRNYKYWSDDEVKKILCWLTLPENEGKLARNKAQACREVAKKLFDGDEYMAISVRSKLMSLEKSFREAEQLRLQLNTCTKDEVLIHDKIKEVSKFHKECKQLFGNNRIDGTYIPPISTSSSSIIPTPSSSTPYSPSTNSNGLIHQYQHQQQYPSYTRQQSSPPPLPQSSSTTSSSNQHILPRHECESTSPYDTNNNNNNKSNNNNSSSLLPHLDEDRLRALSIPPHIMRRGSWSLPRVPVVDLPPVKDDENNHKKRKTSQDSSMSSSNNNNATNPNVRIARYAAKQASYAAKQAEYEAIRSEYEQHKMEYAIRLAEIELDRDVLSIKKLELELELVRSRKQSKTS